LVAERVKLLKGQNRHYLAHEYFNRDWHPMHFSIMAEWLSQCKVSYACSANYFDYVDPINLTGEQRAFLKEIPDAMFRESVRDFMVNQQFRRDYWVKGRRAMAPLERTEAMRNQSIILTTPAADVLLKVSGARGEAALAEHIYKPVLAALSDHKPKTIKELECALRDASDIEFGHIIEAVLVLVGAGHVASVQEKNVEKTRSHTKKLNAYLIDKARNAADISYLASPVTGGGFSLGRFPQMFLWSMMHGGKQPSDWATATHGILASQGQKLVKEGKTLDTDEEALAELNAQAQAFAEKYLPILKALQIV
jgi:hypothetical protein